MRAVASLLMAYAAVAAAFAAEGKRSSAGARHLPSRRRPSKDAVRLPPGLPPRLAPAFAAAAVVAFAAAVLLWPPADGLGMSFVAGTLATSLAATSFVLLEPLLPRALWALAVAAPILAAGCALLG